MGTSLARNLSALLFFASCLSAQSFHFGVKGGYPLTYSENSVTGVDIKLDSSSREFIAGGTAEIGLPAGLSIEGDFLFHPFNVRSLGLILPQGTTNYNVFEIPILGKLRLGHGFAAPFVDAGPEFRFHPGNLSISRDGFAVGGGIEFKLLLLKVSPEFRYTRWANSSFAGANPNQAALLVGVTF